MSCQCHEESDQIQRNVLIKLLVINASLFVVEIIVGLYAQSAGVLADAIDMFADAAVYGIAIYAVGRSLQAKVDAARLSGYFQFTLALLLLLEIARRLIYGSEPLSQLMLIMSIIAMMANIYCLSLIYKQRHGEVHMRASWIFSANDVIANMGLLISALLVGWLHSRWPDLIIGFLIVLIVMWGARLILKESNQATLEATNNKDENTCEIPK